MVRTKSIRYDAARQEPLLIQSGKEFFENCKGKRNDDFFHNTNPIVLELACGRGEYSVGLSAIYPNRNYIGVDIKGERMMIGLNRHYTQRAENNNISPHNIAFLRTIIHHLDRFFAPEEVDEIRIVHPDPRPKGHDERRRLTAPRFLTLYERILKPNGIIRLRTDDDDFFHYSLEQMKLAGFECIDHTRDLDTSPLASHHHGIQTHYGALFQEQGRTIKYAYRKKAQKNQ